MSCLVQPLWSGSSSATSIVCLRSPDSVVIAADSMTTIRTKDATTAGATECKILRAGRFFFTLSGFYRDPARNYDAIRSVRGALGGELPFGESADLVVSELTRTLTAELKTLQSEAPAAFRGMKERGGTLLNILLAGNQNGIAQVSLMKFQLQIPASGAVTLAVERSACPGDCNPQNVKAFYLSDTRPIEVYLGQGHQVDWRSPEKTARFLVDLVIAAGTPGVASPIDVLRIDKAGAHWIERKELCPELPEP
jgi:hypothetical protein